MAVWKRVVWRPVTRRVAWTYGVISALQWTRDNLLPEQYQQQWSEVLKYLPHFGWQTWALVAVLLLLASVLEGVYAEVAALDRDRDAARSAFRARATTSELEPQSQVIIVQLIHELNEERDRNDREVENDHSRRGLLRSGGMIGELINTNGKIMRDHAERFVLAHLDLVRAYSELNDETGQWIEKTLEEHMQGLGRALVQKATARARGMPMTEEHIRETVQRATDIAFSRGRLAITKAVGEARLARGRDLPADVSSGPHGG